MLPPQEAESFPGGDGGQEEWDLDIPGKTWSPLAKAKMQAHLGCSNSSVSAGV